jgi:hypothetical protein
MLKRVQLTGRLARTAVALSGVAFVGEATSQTTVPAGEGDISIVFGLSAAGAQDGGPIQVNLAGNKKEPSRLVIIGPNCEVAMARGSIAISPIDKQISLSREVAPEKGMSTIATYAQHVGFRLSPKEVACGRRVLEQAAQGAPLMLDYGA